MELPKVCFREIEDNFFKENADCSWLPHCFLQNSQHCISSVDGVVEIMLNITTISKIF